MVPQRFFTHGQQAKGDRHVYAARTRFIQERLLGLFERTSWPSVTNNAARGPGAKIDQRIDIGARMRGNVAVNKPASGSPVPTLR